MTSANTDSAPIRKPGPAKRYPEHVLLRLRAGKRAKIAEAAGILGTDSAEFERQAIDEKLRRTLRRKADQ